MSQHPPTDGEADDHLLVELSDTPESPASVRPPFMAARRASQRAASISPFAPRLTRRGRFLRVGGIAGAVLLALVVVLGSFPSARNAAGAWLARMHPTSSAAPAAAYDHFYLLPNPPGTTVLLDGRALATLPYPGDPHPLALARGTHTFKWLSNAFPFPPLSCRLSLPAATSDTCLILAPYKAQPAPPANGSVPLSDPIIATRFSLNTLGDQSGALRSAVDAALAGMGATATLQPGEHYLASSSGPTDTLTRPLRVMLQVQPVAQAIAPPCNFIVPVHPCYFVGQDCGALCTYLSGGHGSDGAVVTYNGIDPVWIAGMYVHTSMRYATLDGVPLEQGMFSGYGIQVILVGILWDGANWHVLPLLGHRAALPPSDDLMCDPALEAFAQGPINYLFLPDAPYDVTLDYASSADPADGCVVRLAGNPHAGEPAIPGDGNALFFERLGVLLAANDAAHQLWPELPQASAAERALADQLAVLAR